jgi:hypothetical protein
MRRYETSSLVPLVAVVMAVVVASCDSADPLGTSLQVTEAGVLENRADRADQVANNPVVRSTLMGNAITGAAGAIRDFNAAGRTWVIDPRSEAVLTARGELRIDVRGLVFAEDPDAGINPSPFFRARVSCLVIMGMPAALVEVNVTTGQFPASPAGDARIHEALDLPDGCLAPVIFVTNAGGTSWFAVTGV